MEEYPNRLGKGMITFAWIVFIGMLTFVFSDFLKQQQNPNQVVKGIENEGQRVIELDRNRYGHYVASGKINDHNVVFLLDTGATSVSIPEKVAFKIGLNAGHAYPVQTANGMATVYETRINRVQLGNIVLHDVQGHINPNMQGDEILLGMSFLKNLDFSQQGDKLTIEQTTF